jgi:hypothetical protein
MAVKPVRERKAIRLIESMVAPLCRDSQHKGSEGSYSASNSASAQDSRKAYTDSPGDKGAECVVDLAHVLLRRRGLGCLVVPVSDVIILMRSARQWQYKQQDLPAIRCTANHCKG